MERDRSAQGYFAHERPEMLPLVPAGAGRILEVGCGEGGFGAAIKRARACEYWGIEPEAAASAVAARRLDRVIHGPFDPADLRGEAFDCVVFNDVLEHLADPEAVLCDCRALLRPGGVVVASLPNLRYFPYLFRLVVRGDLDYEDEGVLDRTHKRLFTSRSVAHLFTSVGYRVRTLRGINGQYLRRRERAAVAMLSALTLGRLADLRYMQVAVVAEPAGALTAGASSSSTAGR